MSPVKTLNPRRLKEAACPQEFPPEDQLCPYDTALLVGETEAVAESSGQEVNLCLSCLQVKFQPVCRSELI